MSGSLSAGPSSSGIRASTALLLALPWLTACDPVDEAPQQLTWAVAPTPEVAIGQLEGADEYLFQSVRAARLLPDGRLVVADAGGPALRIFGADGAFQTEMGGAGDGPGEFRAIGGMWITPQGRIAAWDFRNLRVTYFRPDGELADVHDVRPGEELPAGNLEVFIGSFPDGDIVLASLRFGAPDATEADGAVPDRWDLGRFAPDGVFRERLGEVRGFRRVRGQPLPFTPIPRVVVHADSLYVMDGYGGEISVRDEHGEPVRTIDLPPVDVMWEDRWSALEAELRRRDEEHFLELLERLPRTEDVPRMAGLLVDDQGRIWTKLYEPPADALWLAGPRRPGPGGRWQVVRPDGTPVATVRIPDRVTPVEVRGDRLLGVAEDDLGVERVVVHRVVRSEREAADLEEETK